MQVNIQSVHFDADQKLIDFIESRIEKLDQIFDGLISADVIMRLDKSDVKENKLVEIKISLPGKDLFAKKQSKSFEESTDNCVEALRRQLKKYKGKLTAVH